MKVIPHIHNINIKWLLLWILICFNILKVSREVLKEVKDLKGFFKIWKFVSNIGYAAQTGQVIIY